MQFNVPPQAKVDELERVKKELGHDDKKRRRTSNEIRHTSERWEADFQNAHIIYKNTRMYDISYLNAEPVPTFVWAHNAGKIFVTLILLAYQMEFICRNSSFVNTSSIISSRICPTWSLANTYSSSPSSASEWPLKLRLKSLRLANMNSISSPSLGLITDSGWILNLFLL